MSVSVTDPSHPGDATGRDFQGATILITGGTGSFGSTVTRQLLTDSAIAEVRILSRDEAKQDDLRRSLGDDRARFYLGDVRDYHSVAEAVRGADYVFHAAALKQVPSCEFFPQQAVATNIHGSDNVIRASAEAGVQSVICLSTDKAVYPINAMGMTKALMEKVAEAYARNNPDSATVVSCVRYGNVMYSRGSVIPLFVGQLQRGGSLTVTEPAMTRFLMSLGESVDLVRHAFRHSQPGDLFVRKAPAATLHDLALAVASLFGVRPDIALIGTRHGEKLFEVLLRAEERARAIESPDFFRVPLDTRSLNYGVYTEHGDADVASQDDYTSHNTRRLSVTETANVVAALPEMQAILSAGASPS